MSDTEKLFDEAMIQIYERSKSEINYNAPRFLQLISELGGVKAARKLLSTPVVQSGLERLWEEGRLDLSVEAHVLKPEFMGLFTEGERREALARLKAYGWTD